MTLTIRPPRSEDRPEWDSLYAGYAEFYRVSQTPAMRDIVWGWLHDPAHATRGLVAVSGDRLVGLAHFRPFARPLSASTGGFLDDLFVTPEARGSGTPEARGSGAAAALIEGVRAIGAAQGWTVIRWITAEDNARARALYDRVAQPTAWKTYDMKV